MTCRPSKLRFGTAIALATLCLLTGCASNKVPKDALRLQESTLDVRSMQTHSFASPSEIDILAATIATLQDMEFNIDRVEKSLGVITASKVADADSSSQKAGLLMLDILCVISMSGGCDSRTTANDEQHITATLVVLPNLSRSDEYIARITIQRAVYDKAERLVVLERIDNPQIYQQVFENLSKAMFIQVAEK